jgi:hypothetical protein
MKHILIILNKEIKEYKRIVKMNTREFNEQAKEKYKLQIENEKLKNDLFELSQKYFNNKNI